MLARPARWGFGALVAGALAFGGSQAFAAPRTDATEIGTCSEKTCRFFCQAIGFGTGWCVNGDCFCYID